MANQSKSDNSRNKRKQQHTVIDEHSSELDDNNSLDETDEDQVMNHHAKSTKEKIIQQLKKINAVLSKNSISASMKSDMMKENDDLISELVKQSDVVTDQPSEIKKALNSINKEIKTIKKSICKQSTSSHQSINTYNPSDNICVINPNGRSFADVVKKVNEDGNLIKDKIRVTMSTTKGGKVLAKCRSKEERDKLINNIANSGIEGRGVRGEFHKFVITRLPVKKADGQEYTNEELENELLTRRPDTNLLRESYKRLKDFTSKNGNKVFIISVNEEAAIAIKQDPNFYVGTERYTARPEVKLNQCYKCQEFGHSSAECQNVNSDDQTICAKCAEAGHRTRDCPNPDVKKCINCVREGKQGEGHYAMSDLCPIKRQVRLKATESH